MIFLCGFMGSGKTTFLKRLAPTGLDLDDVVAQQNGLKSGNELGQLIRTVGLEKFRDLEFQGLQSVINAEVPMIALGGGALHDRSINFIKKRPSAMIVWLDVPFQLCWERIQGDSNRPMAEAGKEMAQRLYNDRKVWYQQAHARLGLLDIDTVRNFEQFVTVLSNPQRPE